MSDPRLYVALDLPSIEEARAMVATLGDVVVSYKVGLQLLPLGGAEYPETEPRSSERAPAGLRPSGGGPSASTDARTCENTWD